MKLSVVGAGIGGLTLALCAHSRGLDVQLFEAAPEISPLGVGINLLPHGTRVLAALGLEQDLRRVSVETSEAIFFDRFGNFIYSEPAGIAGGFGYPQFSIHRGDLQMLLLSKVKERLGAEAVHTGCRATGAESGHDGAILHLVDAATGAKLPPVLSDAVVAADGINSAIRKQFFPAEGSPVYAGINMWRGTTRWKPFLTGASNVRAGSLRVGKMVIYPIRDNIDDDGRQLINWVAEIRTDTRDKNDWNRSGKLEDFLPIFADWQFDWLDVAAMIKAADVVLEYPMVDRDPLPWWTQGRVTLLGDAAHPMYPRGSNGAAQAILDAETLAVELAAGGPVAAALARYEAVRRPATSAVVERNRTQPPDFLIETVYDRTGGARFERIDDVISQAELAGLMRDYQKVAGWDRAQLAEKAGTE